jgi:hypothetical protein
MAEMRDDRRPNGTTAPPCNPTTTFDDAVEMFGLGVLLRLPTELHKALAAESRREVLAYLYGLDREVPITELADYLAATGIEADRRRAVIVLHHAHLPELDDAGLIRWNREDEVVRLTADTAQN